MAHMHRRAFIRTAGVSAGVVGAGAASALAAANPGTAEDRPSRPDFQPHDWTSVRSQFPLSRGHNHMATFLLASHPHAVSAAIERHRRSFDENPADYWHEHFRTMDASLRAAVAEYTGGSGDHIALTDSTTMGLGLVYSSIRLRPSDEVVVGAHGHYSTIMAWEHRAERDGTTARVTPLYGDPAQATVDEIVSRMRKAITDRTRVLAVTWVHSSTGVKMPIAAMAQALDSINARRDRADRVLFCVDGVHGFGNQRDRVEDLGCDVFIAGAHKWIFGPRGTGIVWARPDAWARMSPIIPSFGPNYGVWVGRLTPDMVPVGDRMTPGGFHSFEHRWALPEAFAFHHAIGMDRVHARITALNTQCKAGLAEMKHVHLHTPRDPALSAGINCFEVHGVEPEEYVERMHAQGVVASTSPYRVSYPRLAPSLINDEAEVEAALQAVAALA